MTKYEMTCPIPSCGHILEFEAETEEDAVEGLINTAKEHINGAHPDAEEMHEEDMKTTTKQTMRKAS